MAKRAQQDSGEGRVTAKSRPMMNLTARTFSFVSSSASSNPGRTSCGHQDLERSVPIDDRSSECVFFDCIRKPNLNNPCWVFGCQAFENGTFTTVFTKCKDKFVIMTMMEFDTARSEFYSDTLTNVP